MNSYVRHVVGALLASSVSFGAAAADAEGWSFSVAPYVWMIGIEGEVGAHGNVAEVDESFSDILENMDGAFLAQFEAHNGRLGLVLSPIYLKVSVSGNGPLGFVDAEVELESTIVDAFATWEVAPGFDILGGIRYSQMDVGVELEFPGGATESRNASKNWLDPIVGARWIHSLSDKWMIALRGDVGVGGDSDSMWSANASLGYVLGKQTTLFFGYRWLDDDYEDGNTTDLFKADLRIEGPIIGVRFNLQGNP